jgi:hypothetical protein
MTSITLTTGSPQETLQPFLRLRRTLSFKRDQSNAKIEVRRVAGIRYVLQPKPFPDQADDYRHVLIDSVREAWKAYAPSIDRAVGNPVMQT